MKRFLTVLLLFTFLIIPQNVFAQDQSEDMSVFRIAILLSHCDQADEIKVVRLRNSETERVAFCIEPYVSYVPSINEYYKTPDNDLTFYNLYRAFEQLGKTDEAFITVQLMIWEKICGESFTFDGKGAQDYLKDEVLQLLEEYETSSEPEIINEESYVGEERTLEFADIQKYDVQSDVRITDISQDSFSYIIEEYSEDPLSIELTPKSSVPEGAYTYRSEGSQDLYIFEGTDEAPRPYRINIRALDSDLSISFKKLDLNDQPIENAAFTLYKISEAAEEKLYFLKAGSRVDLYEKLLEEDVSHDQLSLEVSERYEQYIDNGIIETTQTGYFPFTIKNNGEIMRQGRVYVSGELADDFKTFDVETVKTQKSEDRQINTMNGLKPDNMYYLCESEPERGYTYYGNPCQLIDTHDDSYLQEHVFYNQERHYTLRLIKNDPDKTINLNGALFRLKYSDEGQQKELLFKTGSLNIFNEEGYRYLFYRHENDEEIKVKELNGDHYIEDNVPYGKYYYYLSNDEEINTDKLINQLTVQEGSFIIEDLPYSAKLYFEELEAPRGYFIDEAEFEASPDIAYSDIIFTNSRINRFDIIPHNQRRIPKTCIGD